MATLPPSLPRSRATGLPFDTRGRSQRERAQARAAARLHVPQVRGSTRKRYRLLGETVEAAPTTRTSRRREEKRRASMAGSADQAARMAAWRARSSRRRRWQVEASGAGGSIGCWWKHREAGEKRGGSCAAAEEGMRDASRCARARAAGFPPRRPPGPRVRDHMSQLVEASGHGNMDSSAAAFAAACASRGATALVYVCYAPQSRPPQRQATRAGRLVEASCGCEVWV